MDKTLIDTDIYSEIGRARHAHILQRMAEYLMVHGQLTISTPTVVEIAKGLARAHRLDRLAALSASLGQLNVLSLDQASAQIAGEIYGKLELAGKTIGRIDPMIAGIALSHGYAHATGNTQHYQRVVSLGFPLKLINWRE